VVTPRGGAVSSVGAMDDERPPEGPVPGDEGASEEPQPTLPSLPPEVSVGDDEVRRLVDAGAGTPEELRDLAARIRAQRQREDALWREEVRPALKKAKKRRFQMSDLVERDEEGGPNLYLWGFGAVALGLVLVMAATRSSIIWVLIPLVAVLVYAYREGRQPDAPDESPPPTADDPD
jgi:hypothetical protein